MVGFCVVCGSKMKLKDEAQVTCSKNHGEKLRLRKKRALAGEKVADLHCRSCGGAVPYREEVSSPCRKCLGATSFTLPSPLRTCEWCGGVNEGAGEYCSSRCEELDQNQKAFLQKKPKQPPKVTRKKPSPPDGTREGFCPHCGKRLPEGAVEAQKYCSKTHSRAARKRRQEEVRKRSESKRVTFDPNVVGRCPRPDKVAHSSKEEAMRVIETTQRWGLVPYLCNCNLWHVGDNPLGSKENFEAGYASEEFRRKSKHFKANSVKRMREDLHRPRKRF